jgi:hypothetical protein
LLNAEAKLLWVKPAGSDAPEIDRELAGNGHDGFFARGPGGERSFL